MAIHVKNIDTPGSRNTINYMETIQIHDKKFRMAMSGDEIRTRIKPVADRLNHDMAGRNPLFLSVLNGAFMFTADLLRMITIPCEVSFVKLASYQGVVSTGHIKEIIGINEDLTDRTVVIVEDIVDTGRTMERMLESLGTRHPKDVHICSLLVKPEKLEVDLNIEYLVMSVPDRFVIGYGFDYDQQGRNLPDLYTLAE